MISVRREDVPEFLRRGKLYKALDEEDSTVFEIPNDCFKENLNVNNVVEFTSLLLTLRFWMVEEAQQELLVFVLTHDMSAFEVEGSDERNLLLSINFGAQYLQLEKLNKSNRISFATKHRMGVPIIEVLSMLFCDVPEDLCSIAAEAGDLDVLKFARSRNCKWGDAAQMAVRSGQVDCVRYCANQNDLLTLAVETGQLTSLRALHESQLVLHESLCSLAAKHGHMNCLQYLFDMQAPWDEKTVESAIAHHQHDCLIFAHANGCPMSDMADYIACSQGN